MPEASPIPAVSVITICRNNRGGLERTLESVWAQEVAGVESVVIDGGSGDGTRPYLEANSHRIHFWQSARDGGVFDAQNRGLRSARGRFVLFLNSGDRFATRQSLGMLLAAAHDGADVIYGDMLVEEDGKLPWRKRSPASLSVPYLYVDSLAHCSTLIRRDLLLRLGGYDGSLDIVADWRFSVEAYAREAARFVHVPHPISIFEWGGVSSSARFGRRQYWERRQVWTTLFPGAVLLPAWVVTFVLARRASPPWRWPYKCMEAMLLGWVPGDDMPQHFNGRIHTRAEPVV